MPTKRIHHLRPIGLMVTVGLLAVLAVQVGLTAAATGTSGASSSRVLRGAVSIHLEGTLSGPQCTTVGRGRFTLSGAISDHGTFVDRFHGCWPVGGPYVRTFFGANGTIRITGDNSCVPSDTPLGSVWLCRSQWRISNGTKAYAALRGRGHSGTRARQNGEPFHVTMVGTVSG